AAADNAKKAMEIYESLGDELGATMSAVCLGRSLSFTGRYAEGKALLDRAATVLRERNLPKLLGDCLESLGTGACIANDIQAAQDYYREALPIVQAAGDERKVSVILSNKAETEFQAGAIEAALDFNAQGLALDRARKNLISAAGSLSNRAAYLIAAGQIPEALVCAREALQIQHEAQLAALAVAAVQHVAAIATVRGDAQRGARLLGFVEARLIALESVREYTEQREADTMLAELGKTLDKTALRRLMDEGSLWSEEHALAAAFEVS
ncbi:MAG TPA: tetratricopeptide repeat protein, partial [Candidatus Eremiobacteraceae bacterium]|nr:tetratricopeptide repeat protein [Candidatus Eremiobacteraceae bacterium]